MSNSETPKWEFLLKPGGQGEVKYKGELVKDVRQVTVDCVGGESTKVMIELAGLRSDLRIFADEVEVKPVVKVEMTASYICNDPRSISLYDFLEIQKIANRYPYSLEDLSAAYSILLGAGLGFEDLERHCKKAAEENIAVYNSAAKEVQLLKALEGAP